MLHLPANEQSIEEKNIQDSKQIHLNRLKLSLD